jgi:hypothetical protein
MGRSGEKSKRWAIIKAMDFLIKRADLKSNGSILIALEFLF